MSLSPEQFVQQLVQAGLLRPDEAALWGAAATAEELAQGLVRAGRLTEFQAAQALAGKARSLVLDDYVILDRIGSGGMGQVFRAQHLRMRRIVALKVLNPTAMKDAAAVARFQREVHAAARLAHPNIVAAYDARERQGLYYLAMEYVDGCDLASILKSRGPLPLLEATQCVLQTARGLAYAHAQGVVHRDIKPGNLLVDRKGVVKILDMGLARVEQQTAEELDQQLTQIGQVMGTVDYMAPEQALDTHLADARSDVYSLGCTLYRIVTGQNLYAGDTAVKKILAHREQPVPSLRLLRPDAPRALDRLFRRMVAKRPDDRHAPTEKLVSELERVCEELAGMEVSVGSQELGITRFFRALVTRADREAAENDHSSTQQAANRTAPAPTKSPAESKPGIPAPPPPPARAGSSIPGPRPAGSAFSGPPVYPAPPQAVRTTHMPLPPWWQTRHTRAALAAAALAVLSVIVLISWNGRPRPVVKPDGESPPSLPQASMVTAAGVAPASAPASIVAPFDASQAQAAAAAWAAGLGTAVTRKNGLEMTLTLIPSGEFRMGATAGEIAAATRDRSDAQRWEECRSQLPQHRLQLGKPYWIGQTPVTVGQFRRFVEAAAYQTDAERGASPSRRSGRDPTMAQGADGPVVDVSWNDAVTFCNWLSVQESLPPCYQRASGGNWRMVPGPGYRLPTEAEWEFACRAGTTSAWFCGGDAKDLVFYAWFAANAAGKTHPVATRMPNAFGLFDMAGNVRQWAQDWYDADYFARSPLADPPGPEGGSRRVVRGGAFDRPADGCRSACRGGCAPHVHDAGTGFRVARDALPAAAPRPGT